MIALRKNLADRIRSVEDLSSPGVSIAVANKDMAAIGRVADAIIEQLPQADNIRKNIVVKASTVNELLELLTSGEVDAAIVWEDMLTWPSAEGLASLAIAEEFNQVKEIWMIDLVFSENPGQSAELFEFIAGPGRRIFHKHGFTE